MTEWLCPCKTAQYPDANSANLPSMGGNLSKQSLLIMPPQAAGKFWFQAWALHSGSWSCGEQALRQVSEVRYLGAIFQSGQGFLPSLARLQHRAQAAWAQLSRQYGTLQCEKGVWLMLQLYGACVLPAGSFGCEGVAAAWPISQDT